MNKVCSCLDMIPTMEERGREQHRKDTQVRDGQGKAGKWLKKVERLEET